jgi:hypothetical protein
MSGRFNRQDHVCASDEDASMLNAPSRRQHRGDGEAGLSAIAAARPEPDPPPARLNFSFQGERLGRASSVLPGRSRCHGAGALTLLRMNQTSAHDRDASGRIADRDQAGPEASSRGSMGREIFDLLFNTS